MDKIIPIIQEYKIYFIITIITIILIITQVVSFNYLKKEIQINEEPIEIINEQEETTPETVNEIYIDIKGEVKKPGTYKMQENQRVIDAIKKAGGLTKYANTKANNLSKKLTDEMVIIIYDNDEIKEFEKIKQQEQQIIQNCNKEDKTQINNSCIKEEEKQEEKNTLISLNKGTKEELMTLPGIGEAKANSIIEYRKTTEFTSIEQIKEISGIKDSLYEQIKNLIEL